MNRSLIREYLTDAEINECLTRAYWNLSAEQRENLQSVTDELTEIPRLGPKSALGLIFAVNQAPALERLNETLKGG